MSSTNRAWIAAASIGAVEALKDQGLARWNYAFRSLHQHAKKNLGASYTLARRLSSVESSSSAERTNGEANLKESEKSLRTVMYLSCWGPN
ncbi:uncharacterized protein [Aristolochia californica]|uniref:uncharacterized protein n=1 Tax=Aristolochia californica TaxID=171875 RepID=UPI0035DE97CF